VLRHFDHVTVVVRDLDAAKRFFALLGFREARAVVIAGPPFDAYMGVADIEADHVTLVHETASPRLEVQLLRYRRPEPWSGGDPSRLDALGYNHVCFAVDDVAAEVARLAQAGVAPKTSVLDFHDRKLVFLSGPEGITIELAEWQEGGSVARARIAVLRAAYAAFNRRDLDAALAMLADDVAWPDLIQGRVLHGVAPVRAYWAYQFATIDSRVEPLAFEPHEDRVLVVVDQRVRRPRPDGAYDEERARVGHLYAFRGDRVVEMRVHADLDAARAALTAKTREPGAAGS
jgi:catechol 2,3-dioxygenase-like lactoylglutathione lyase family enzyme/ketosteroid isomerase-like protein